MAFQSKDPLGLEMDVELHVSENELMAIDDDLRPTFVKGMSCTVPQCEGRAFNSINTLWKHWKRVHRQKVALYQCEVQGPCNFSSTDIGQVRKHQVKNHQLNNTKFQITMDMVINNKYISPGDARCPKKCSNLNTCGRDEAAASRRALPVVNKVKSGNNVNRDECVQVRESTVNGITKYHTHITRKHHWKPNPNRR